MYEEKQKDHVHVGDAKQVSNHPVLVYVRKIQEKIFHSFFRYFERQISITGILELQTVGSGEHWFCL